MNSPKPHEVTTAADFIRFVDDRIPQTTITYTAPDRKVEVERSLNFLKSLRLLSQTTLGCKAVHLWNSPAGPVAVNHTSRDTCILHIEEFSSRYFVDHTPYREEDQLGHFEEFVRDLYANPDATASIQFTTPEAGVDALPFIACRTTFLRSENKLPAIRLFHLAPTIAAQALWQSGVLLSKPLINRSTS